MLEDKNPWRCCKMVVKIMAIILFFPNSVKLVIFFFSGDLLANHRKIDSHFGLKMPCHHNFDQQWRIIIKVMVLEKFLCNMIILRFLWLEMQNVCTQLCCTKTCSPNQLFCFTLKACHIFSWIGSLIVMSAVDVAGLNIYSLYEC